jgi:hypothetical protein
VQDSHLKPAQIVGLFSLLVLASCTTAPPRIGAGLHGPVRDVAEEFDRRVKARFPIGSDETVLRGELEREKFVITRDKDSPFGFSAFYQSGGFGCVDHWRVHWSVLAGTIAGIGGHWEQICL